MYDFETFTEELKTRLEDELGDNYNITVQPMVKTNRRETGIVIKNKYSDTAPVLSAENLYEDYKNGTVEDEIVGIVKGAIENTPDFSLSDIDKESAKEHIRLSLMSYDRNAQLLKDVPHERIADLAAIPRWYIEDGMSFIVNDKVCRNLRLTKEEVLDMAHSNLESGNYTVRSMGAVLNNALNSEHGMGASFFPESEFKMFVVSNEQGIDGSSEILNPRAMKETREKIGEDFVILPSSRHEVICIPKSTASDISYFKDMVRTVNRTTVDIRDQLSDSVYEYNDKTRTISIAGQEHTIKRAVPMRQQAMSRGR
ncbi:hypothetical protein SAMN04487770_102179 [Butyrivibrio sp. ob235]|uniref:DUF5688 family protein n=1 Tax=Butyrivibrio sp. ob235 TaxID=1761780 RepID=UPI0008C67180|nr:DUF5688 family protein [Butyrivibrio sp. ob235]SEK65208.1 hypothetical protein SAMN04487770_102179 [Butyrivibrio sp. ob235]